MAAEMPIEELSCDALVIGGGAPGEPMPDLPREAVAGGGWRHIPQGGRGTNRALGPAPILSHPNPLPACDELSRARGMGNRKVCHPEHSEGSAFAFALRSVWRKSHLPSPQPSPISPHPSQPADFVGSRRAAEKQSALTPTLSRREREVSEALFSPSRPGPVVFFPLSLRERVG